MGELPTYPVESRTALRSSTRQGNSSITSAATITANWCGELLLIAADLGRAAGTPAPGIAVHLQDTCSCGG